MFILPQFQFFKWKTITSAAAAQVITYDPYFNYTSLLINAESTSTGSQNSTFIDSSTNNFSITANGSPTQTSLTPYSPNDRGVYFSSGSRLSVPAGADFAYGLGAFTIEAWVNPASFSTNRIIFSQSVGGINYFVFMINTSRQLQFTGHTFAAGTAVPASSGVLIANQWQHVALVREGSGANQLKFYVNGILAGVGTTSVDFTNTSYAPSVGAYSHELVNNLYTGYISNLRVVKGQALYTGNFTPSVSALSRTSVGATGSNVVPSLTGTVSLLTCQSNRFVDNSLSARAITVNGTPRIVNFHPFSTYTNSSNSVYLNGTSSLIVTRSSEFLTPANTDFTIEAWVYLTANPSNATEGAQIMGFREAGTNADWFINIGGTSIGIPASNPLSPVFYMDTGSMKLSSSSQLNLNTWNHIAVTRSGTASNNLKLFVNGLVVNSTSNNNSLVGVGSNNLCIGADSANDESRYTGYISNVRMVSGQGLYTGNFTPATAHLTNNSVGTTGANVAASLTGTVVLLACQNQVVTTENSSSPKTITTAGTPFATTNTPFLTTTGYTPLAYSPSTHGGSVYFNGSSYVSSSAPSLSGNYTLECWFYKTGAGSSGSTILHAHAGAANGTHVWINTLNQLVIDNGSVGQTAFTTFTITNNQWYHLAIVRSGSTTTAYLNGAVAGSNSYAPATNDSLSVGRYITDSRWAFVGYISDVRLVNGSTVYTTTFTPPTAPLSVVAGTSLLLKANNGAVCDATGNNGITLFGNASASSTVSKFGSKSLYFDGTNNYLRSTADASLYNFGTSNFTVEGWIYPLSNPASFSMLLCNTPNGATYGAWEIRRMAAGTIQMFLGSTSGNWDIAINVGTGTAPLNSWTHFALTRSGSTFTLFVNGSAAGTASSALALKTMSTSLVVGANADGTYKFNGYMDDIRITSGINRYAGLSSFTIPTSAFPTQ